MDWIHKVENCVGGPRDLIIVAPSVRPLNQHINDTRTSD